MQSSRIMLATAILSILGAASVCAQQTPAAPTTSPSTPAAPVAADQGQSGLPAFDELDKSHHGYLSRSDIPRDVDGLNALRAHFMEYDQDDNGRLSPDEYAAYVAAQSGNKKSM